MTRYQIVNGPGILSLSTALGLSKRQRARVSFTIKDDKNGVSEKFLKVLMMTNVDPGGFIRIICKSLGSEFYIVVYHPHNRKGTLRSPNSYEMSSIGILAGLDCLV